MLTKAFEKEYGIVFPKPLKDAGFQTLKMNKPGCFIKAEKVLASLKKYLEITTKEEFINFRGLLNILIETTKVYVSTYFGNDCKNCKHCNNCKTFTISLYYIIMLYLLCYNDEEDQLHTILSPQDTIDILKIAKEISMAIKIIERKIQARMN